jgi:hypothetical protein
MSFARVRSTQTDRVLDIRAFTRELDLNIGMPGGSAQAGIRVTPAELAEALNKLPGFTVKYEAPIEVPQYLGAVVARGSGSLPHERYVRYNSSSETSLPWISQSGTAKSDDDIAGILANGGYERQPEFPPNHG